MFPSRRERSWVPGVPTHCPGHQKLGLCRWLLVIFQSSIRLATVWLVWQAGQTCVDKCSLSFGHLSYFPHHPLLFSFSLRAAVLPLICLLSSLTQNPSSGRESRPHITFNLNINFSILNQRALSSPAALIETWSGKKENRVCGAWLTSLWALLYFSFQRILTSPRSWCANEIDILFCFCWAQSEVQMHFLMVCFPAGLNRIKATNHQWEPKMSKWMGKPFKMLEKNKNKIRGWWNSL